ncbi:DUF3857 domain-containing protein [Marinifilum sp.]|uniref:DUF3857 domain-containing protein n=1 Tax=Marinifilum sp. TaxID=2033137 RepID=UPI003BAC9F1E
MKKLIVVIAFFISILSYSQINSRKFPEVSVKDLQARACPIDSNAAAQIILDVGNVYFIEEDYQIMFVFEKKTRIQVLDKSGYDYAKITIPYYQGANGKEKIKKFKATSYSLENGVIKKNTIEKKVLLDDNINRWWNQKKYAFTNVKEGSIIDYSYKIVSPFMSDLREWYFQYDIPVRQSKFKISLCPYYNYIVLKKGFLEYHKDTVYTEPFGFTFLSKKYKTRVYEWETLDVPAFKEENMITCEDDNRMMIDFQLESYFGYRGGKFELMTSWEMLNEELLERTDFFGGYINANKRELRKILENLKLENKSDKEKIEAINEYVLKHYLWNGYFGLFSSQLKKSFLESKTGNVADVNLFLHSLLKEAGIESFPVILSTRDHGKVYYKYPFLNLFNYVVLLVKDQNEFLFMDATHPFLPIGLLPQECINGYGLIVKNLEKDEKAEFMPLNPSKENRVILNQSIEIDLEKEQIKGKNQLKVDGYKAEKFRSKISQKGTSAIQYDIIGDSPVELSNLVAKDIKNNAQPLVVNYNSRSNLDKVGDKILINPFPINSYQENLLNKASRVYPVDYGYLEDEQLFTTIKLPDQCQVEFLPEKETIVDEELGLEYHYSILPVSNFLQVKAVVKRNQLKYKPENYNNLKAFYDSVVSKLNERIILKRNKSL